MSPRVVDHRLFSTLARRMTGTALMLVACRGDARDPDAGVSPRPPLGPGAEGSTAAVSAATDAARETRLAPLAGFFEPLPVGGHPDAWMSLPTGATGKRPVVIVIHGAGDRPDWQCGGWRRATAEFPFIVCPRGAYSREDSTKTDARYTHRGGASLLAYIDGSLAALEAKYPDYADTTNPILAGFSLGASQVLALALRDPRRFPRVALVEGATEDWSDVRVTAYLAGGGRRVLYAAGQRTNEAAARVASKHLLARGLDARVVYAPTNHTFDPPLEDAVLSELAWFVAGDPRWTL
jgi:predicted esterase